MVSLRKLVLFSILLFLLAVSFFSLANCSEEASVDIRFEVLTGLYADYYSGDYFWYNITITNSGNSTINATFTVTVYNTTRGSIGSRSFAVYLIPNQTTSLYPNYTRAGRDEVDVFFMDTTGTYTIDVTSNMPIRFFRYYDEGGYTWEYGHSHMNIEVMPSYQRSLNEKLNSFFEQNQRYVQEMEKYIQASRNESIIIRNFTIAALILSFFALLINMFAIPKKERRDKKWFLMYILVFAFFIVLIVLLIGFTLS